MEGLSAKGLQDGTRPRAQAARFCPESRPVGAIAEDRMSDMGKMHPDLVGAAGFQCAGQQAYDWDRRAGWGEALQDLPVGDSRPAVTAHRLLVARLRVTAKRSVDRALRPRRRTPHQC